MISCQISNTTGCRSREGMAINIMMNCQILNTNTSGFRSREQMAGIAQWFECQIHDWKVASSNPCRSSRRIFFSRVDFLCWLLFWYPVHPRVTAVARKRSRSFCQKCMGQVTANHAFTLHMWLCMKWHGAWLYDVHRTCAQMAAVSCSTSYGGYSKKHTLKSQSLM